jgi:tRNA (adenine57-N1/adenine58-N1)-methyltransferase
LDVQKAFDYIGQVRQALKPGGHFGCILPTANQVERVLTALFQYDFAFVDVCEIILRYYKPVPERFRPTDRMVAHTGYLVFGRPMLPVKDRLAGEFSQGTGLDEDLEDLSGNDPLSEEL